MKLEGLLPSNEKHTINMRMNKINSVAVNKMSIYVSNNSIQGYGICYIFKVWICSGHCRFILWKYHTCPLFSGGLHSLFLHLKKCVIISEFGPRVLCGFAKETRLTKTKPLLNVHTYWTAWNVEASKVTPSSNDL